MKITFLLNRKKTLRIVRIFSVFLRCSFYTVLDIIKNKILFAIFLRLISNSDFRKRMYNKFNMGSKTTANANNLFKFYSNKVVGLQKRRILNEKDYNRFLSIKALSQNPSPTKQLSDCADENYGKINKNLSEGMPNEATFPFIKLELTTSSGEKLVIEGQDLDLAQQYTSAKGLPCLVSELQRFQEELHRPPPLDRDLLVTNGIHHGLHLCTEILVNIGDPVISTEFSYSGLHSILQQYEVEYLGIREDEDGLIPEALESLLKRRQMQGLKMPRVMILVPTVSNPTGFLLSEERKRRIYDIACEYDLIIVEDEVYMFLNYTDVVTPSFLSLDTTGRVIRLDSFSKVISAGLRVGWLTGPKMLVKHAELVSLTQIMHSCTLAQSILYRLIIDRERLATQLLRSREFYKKQRDYVNNALKQIEDLIEWKVPDGGYYLWLKIRGVDDVRNMVFNTAFEKGLMLEPGNSFAYDSESPFPYIRITFTRMNLKEIVDNVLIIGEIIRKEKNILAKESDNGY